MKYYQLYKVISHAKHHLFISLFGFTSHCKHTPTCSQYMAKAIKKEGFRGLFKGVKRIASCY